MEPESSLPCSQEFVISPYLETNPVHTLPSSCVRYTAYVHFSNNLKHNKCSKYVNLRFVTISYIKERVVCLWNHRRCFI